MSKSINDSLSRSDTGCFIQLYPYGNSRRQRVKHPSWWRCWWWLHGMYNRNGTDGRTLTAAN